MESWHTCPSCGNEELEVSRGEYKDGVRRFYTTCPDCHRRRMATNKEVANFKKTENKIEKDIRWIRA